MTKGNSENLGEITGTKIGSNKLSPTQIGTNKGTLRKKVETEDMYRIHGKIGMTGESIRIHGREEQRKDTRRTHGKTNNRGHTEITRRRETIGKTIRRDTRKKEIEK